MLSVDFPQRNIIIAENQEEYEPLYARVNRNDRTVPVTVCFQLNQSELEEIVKTGKIWFTQLTFGLAYTPIQMTTENPFAQ